MIFLQPLQLQQLPLTPFSQCRWSHPVRVHHSGTHSTLHFYIIDSVNTKIASVELQLLTALESFKELQLFLVTFSKRQ